MRDALGGLVNIAIIVVFITLVSGFMAFNINYTKAFRVKNKIITTLEQYEGNCEENSDCDIEIRKYAESLGYSTSSPNVKNYDTCRNGYCFTKVDQTRASDNQYDSTKKVYFKVVTQINVDIPIINRVLPNIPYFQVSGNTKLIETS